jgi:hypothetical protein
MCCGAGTPSTVYTVFIGFLLNFDRWQRKC